MKKYKEQSILRLVKPMVWGLIVSWILVIGVCMIGSVMVLSEKIPETAAGYCTTIALLIGSLTGGFLVWKMAGNKILLHCAVYGLLLCLSLLCVGTIMFDGAVEGVGVTLVMTMGGSLGSALIGMGRKKRSVGHKMKFKR